MNEQDSIAPSPSGSGSGNPVQEAREQIKELGSDPGFQDRLSSGRLALAEKKVWDSLHQKAYPENVATDDSFHPQAAKPEHYQFPMPSDPNKAPTKEAAELESQARSALSAAGFSQGAGSHVVERISKVVNETKDFDGEKYENHRLEQGALMKNLWGDRWERKLEVAKLLTSEIGKKHPKLGSIFTDTPVGNSLDVILPIVHQSENLLASKGVDVDALYAFEGKDIQEFFKTHKELAGK